MLENFIIFYHSKWHKLFTEKIRSKTSKCNDFKSIGKPIDEPKAATYQVILKDGFTIGDVKENIVKVADNWLANVQDITQLVRDGKVRTF